MSSLDSAKDSGTRAGTAAAPARQVDQLKGRRFRAQAVGIGLPCANCKTYFAADLPACPVCKGKQRVSAAEPLTTVTPAEQLPDPKQLEEERERFLRDFNSQVVANPLPPDSPTPAMHCDRREKHPNSHAPANICQSCYDELQERVDVLEAAMHMDIREAVADNLRRCLGGHL